MLGSEGMRLASVKLAGRGVGQVACSDRRTDRAVDGSVPTPREIHVAVVPFLTIRSSSARDRDIIGLQRVIWRGTAADHEGQRREISERCPRTHSPSNKNIPILATIHGHPHFDCD